jgi:Ca2+-binding EF-hand superfamily protein
MNSNASDDGLVTAKSSKSTIMGDMPRESKRRVSMSKQMYQEEPGAVEEPERRQVVRHKKRTSTLLGSKVVEAVALEDIMRASSKMSAQPDSGLQDVLQRVQGEALKEGLSEEMLEKAYSRFPWLRSTPDADEKVQLPDISKYLDAGIISVLHNLFDEAELECLYEMFTEYSYIYSSHGEEVVEVIHRYDCEASLYWVGIDPSKNICEYCDTQVEQARMSKGHDKLFADDGGVLFTVDMFMRWMSIYRIKHKEWWIMKGCLPEQVAQFVRDKFSDYDTTGQGLKTRQVFELLGALSCRPETVEDQQRVIGYIKLTDVDGSGTIDFLEFLQLLRLVMEYDTKRQRSREMDLIHSTGMTPQQIDGLREAFDQFDTKRSLVLNLGAIKRLFDKGGGADNSYAFDRAKMQVLTDSLRDTDARAARIRIRSKKASCQESLNCDFGEFCVLVHILVVNKGELLDGPSGIRKAFDGLVKRSGLDKWMEKRMANGDEIRGRWEVMMLERHIQTFYQNMMGNDLKVTPRNDETQRPPHFNADKIPKRMTKYRGNDVSWRLLEERDDPPGAMQEIARSGKRNSKDLSSQASKSGPAGSKGQAADGAREKGSRGSGVARNSMQPAKRGSKATK